MLNGFYTTGDLNLLEETKDWVLLAEQTAKTLQAIAPGLATRQSILSYYEEQEQAYQGTIASAFADATTLGPISISDALGTVLFENHQIQVEDEQMIVDVVVKTPGAMTFTVKARGHAGTTAAAHAIGARMVIISISEPEGEISNSYAMGEMLKRENSFQYMTTNIMLTDRAVEQDLEDRPQNELFAMEKVKRFRKHIQQMNNVLRLGVGVVDATTGQNTTNGYEKLIQDFGGETQATIGYATGAFDLDDWKDLMRRMDSKSSTATIIHTNAQTKAKLLAIIPDIDRVDNKGNAGEQMHGLPFIGGITTPDWDGRILSFYIDDTIVGNQFNLVDFSEMELRPRKTHDGYDKMFVISPEEKANSTLISESMKSEFSLELKNGSKMAVCKNL